MTNRIIALIFPLLGMMAGCSRPAHPPPLPVHPVSLQAVSAATPTETAIRYTAAVLPNQQVDLSFKTAGYVGWIAQRRSAAGGTRALDAGDLILADAPLARLRLHEVRAQLEEAEASLSGATAARMGSEAQLALAQADAAHAEQNWTRSQWLYAQAALTRPDYEAAKNRHMMAQAQMNQAAEAIAAQASRVQASKAQRTEANALLGETELRSPFTGVVLNRAINAGSLVASGGVAFTIAEIDKVKVSFFVTDTTISSMHLGDRLPVLLAAVSPSPLIGTVTVVAAIADMQSSTFRVEITLVNDDHRIHPGMIATVSVPAGEHNINAAATVPLAAMVNRPAMGTGYGVFVVRNESGKRVAHFQRVQPGTIEGDNVAILSGLAPGVAIVTRGNSDLQDGDTVADTSERLRP